MWDTVLPMLTVLLVGVGMVMMAHIAVLLFGTRTKQAEPAPLLLFWGLLLLALELCLLAVVDAWVTRLEEAHMSVLLAYGLRLLPLTFPLIGGLACYDLYRHLDAYQTTLLLRRVTHRLAQIDARLRYNESFEATSYESALLAQWEALSRFAAIHDHPDAAPSPSYTASFDAFRAEADRRYRLPYSMGTRTYPMPDSVHAISEGDGHTRTALASW